MGLGLGLGLGLRSQAAFVTVLGKSRGKFHKRRHVDFDLVASVREVGELDLVGAEHCKVVCVRVELVPCPKPALLAVRIGTQEYAMCAYVFIHILRYMYKGMQLYTRVLRTCLGDALLCTGVLALATALWRHRQRFVTRWELGLDQHSTEARAPIYNKNCHKKNTFR